MYQWKYVTGDLLFLCSVKFLVIMCFVSEPQLRDLNNGHTIVGENIVLECTTTSNKPRFSIEWNAPINTNLTLDSINITTIVEKIEGIYKMRSTYIISDSKLKDSSIYYCSAVDTEELFYTKYKYIWVPVYDVADSIIEFNKNATVFDQAKSEVQVYVRAHPETKFYWIDNKTNKTIPTNSSKIIVGTSLSNRITNYISFLKFNRISVEDFGNYTVVAENKYKNKSFVVLVNITGTPEANLTIEKMDMNSSIVKCQATAYPKPKIQWEFDDCQGLSCFLKSQPNTTNTSYWSQFRSEDVGLQTISFVTIDKNNSGLLRAISSNHLGKTVIVQHIHDNQENFEVFSPNMIKNEHFVTIESVLKEDVEIACSVSSNLYYKEIKWYRSGRNLSLDDVKFPIKGFDEYNIKYFDAVYSKVSVLSFNIDKTDQGQYLCKASTKSGKTVAKVIHLVVKELPSLNVATNMQNKTIKVNLGKSVKFYCIVDGYPTPSLKWFKDNATINGNQKFELSSKNQTLIVNDIAHTDNGTYKCVATNRFNTITKVAMLEATEKDFDWLMVIIIVLVVSLIMVSMFVAIKVQKERKLKKELQAAGLANFEEGAIESINPELGLEQQADLLPYDKKFEIATKNLKLGKELGSGAFGVVVQGELVGFPTEESTTIVAVKTVNKFAGHDCIKALASELKIMIHLGSHVNIVNLIGACTKEIFKKKLLVVVEFCPFGNLQDYILKNSSRFIDQRKEHTFDWTIHNSLSTDSSATEDSQTKYISSHDFLVWAFQITKGMEYLASNKVLHGDLAARNVLLTENNIVKISDFGLARNMYKNDVYKKTSNEPLPVKWMAIESIEKNVFSTQSDVWSFGVVLWEFFSLAKTPYPGMQVDQAFYQKLINGYRMEKPAFATTKIYEIMMDCWNANPTNRPTFTKLSERIAKEFEEVVKNHYLEMTSPYVLMRNSETDSGIDNTSISSSPTTQYATNISYFHGYQNTMFIAEAEDNENLHRND